LINEQKKDGAVVSWTYGTPAMNDILK